MKRLLILLTLPLCAMQPKKPNQHYKQTKAIPKAHLGYESDMNSIPYPKIRPAHPTPEQQQLHKDMERIHQEMRTQSKELQALSAAVKYTNIRLDFLQECIVALHDQVEEIPKRKQSHKNKTKS